MKSRILKLMLSILSTSMAAVSLTASTFAYVLINNKVVVPDFDFNIKGQEGLEISLDNVNWSKDLLADSIKTKIVNDTNELYQTNVQSFDEIKFSCTSINQIKNDNDEYIIEKDENNQIKFHYDEVIKELNPNTNLNEYRHIDTPANANVDKGYIKFDLYLKSKSTYENKKDFTLKMTNDTSIKSTLTKVKISNRLTTKKFGVDSDDKVIVSNEYKTYFPGEDVYVDISNAIRLGIYNVDQDENLEFSNYNNFNIYEMANEYDLGSVALALDDYTDKDINNPENNAMYTYYNNYFVNYPFTNGATPGEAFNTKNKQGLLDTEFGTFTFNEQRNDYNVIKLEIYIWLEGWDADYFIGIPEDTTIKVDLGFQIV